MKMTLKSRYVCHQACFYPACEKSVVLFQLLKRAEIYPAELPLIGQLGFEIETKGDDWILTEALTKKIEELNEAKKIKAKLNGEIHFGLDAEEEIASTTPPPVKTSKRR